MLYCWKAKGPRTSKMIFWTVKSTNTQIQIRKYTNTACEKVPEIPNILIFLKSRQSQDIKNDIMDWTDKCTNTPIQRHKYTNILWWSAGNIQHVLYFRKTRSPRISKMIFWTVKYTNAKIQIHRRSNSYVYPNLKLWITALTHWLTFALYHQVYLAYFWQIFDYFC